MHHRRVILEDIRGQLQAVTGLAGAWIQRIPPARIAYPCVTLNAESESVDTVSIHNQPRPQDRTLLVAVQAWIRGTPDDEKAESDMEEAALLIETALRKPTNAQTIRLVSTDFEVSEEEPDLHVCRLSYEIKYITSEFTPQI